jgi:hypothetical protein
MSALSNLDIFGLWMMVALVFALPLAWLSDRDDATERALRVRREEFSRLDCGLVEWDVPQPAGRAPQLFVRYSLSHSAAALSSAAQQSAFNYSSWY